jgi:outer membrane receptor protein involved in Fe transport
VVPAFAQETGTIRGRIESSITGEALSGVLVTFGDGSKPARTGTDGRFVLGDVPAGEGRLTLELLPDFVTTTELLEIQPGVITQVSLSMMPVTVLLDELLVEAGSGRGEGVLRTYSDDDIPMLASKGSVVDLLADGFPGVEVRRGSGQVGAAASLLIRGVNSISLSAEPLVYLDGILVGGNSGVRWLNAGDVLGILDMIPAETVRSIEVLKGPAATRFGIGASNGVILIRTR